MKYEFVIYGHYKEAPIFTYDCPHGIQMGQDELERGNKIMGICPTNSCDKIRVVLAIEPRVFSMCELKWIYIGESYIKHEIIWPIPEHIEAISNEVAEVIDGLKIKTVHCIFYIPNEPKPIEVDLELFNGNRVVFKGMNFVIPEVS